MRTGARSALLLAATILLAAPSVAQDASATLVWKKDERGSHKTVTLKATAEAPDDVDPIEGQELVRYVDREFGGRRLLAAAVFRPEPVRLLIDQDFDGDLLDEDPVHLAGAGTALIATIELAPEDGADEIPLRFLHHSGAGRTCLHLTVLARMEGEVVLAGRVRRVAMLDGNADFRFDDPKEDGLLLDVDGDGELNVAPGSWERLVPGRAFRLRDAGFVAEAGEGGRITFVRLKAEEVPAAAPRPWTPRPAPAAGRKYAKETARLEQLVVEYRKAAALDRMAGASVATKSSRIVGRIGRIPTATARTWLLRLADKDPNVSLRSAAVRALGSRDHIDAAAQVTEIARSGAHSVVRGAAIQALHGMGAPGLEALLFEMIAEENDASVFGQAATHLAYLGTPEAIRAIEAVALDRTQPGARLSAFRAAVTYGREPPRKEFVLAASRQEYVPLRAEALKTAYERGWPEAHALALEALAADDATDLLKKAAVRVIGTSDHAEDIARLVAATAGASEDVRRTAVSLLRPVRAPAIVAVLLERLSARATPERRMAAEVLEGIPGPAVERALLERLPKERDADVRTALLRGLGSRDSPEAAKALAAEVDPGRASAQDLEAVLTALARLGLGDEKVRAYFERVAGAKDWKKRVLAVVAAGASRDARAADLLTEAIDDEAWQVRIEAVEGLGKLRLKSAVPTLIERLAKDDSPRIRQAAADALYWTTGQNFYDIVRLWRRWWKEKGAAFEIPEKPPGAREKERAAGSVADFYGIPVDSDRIVFVIDQSGSMSGLAGTGETKLERAVEQTLMVVSKLPSKARVNVILFETGVHPWQKKLVRMSRKAKATLAKHLKSQRPMGGTNIYDPLEMALLIDGVDTIYLLSDGMPGMGKWVKREDIVREIARINRTRRIAIHCVAVGMDSQLLRDLAAGNGGQYARR